MTRLDQREKIRCKLIDEPPTGMTDEERALVERLVMLPWDEQVRRAAKRDLIILVDFRNGMDRFTMVPRKRAATASPGLRDRPALQPGELWASWLVAGDGFAHIMMRLSVERVAHGKA
jgi:hypothetical protein